MEKAKLKILCYGASVTAQKGDSGYVQRLTELLPKDDYEVIKIGRGASHFEYAGYGFSREIADYAPNILIVDWLSPSMKEFSVRKLTTFNKCFTEQGVRVIWVNFPRKDDLNNQRKCFSQVRQSCKDFNLEFIDLNKYLVKEPDKYLRDVVHTTEVGARLYAEVLFDLITSKQNPRTDNSIDVTNLPVIVETPATVDQSTPFKLAMKVQKRKVDILLECFIGPNTPFLKFRAESGGYETIEKVVNPLDPWCYYTRKMVLPTVSLESTKPITHLSIHAETGEPLDLITLNKALAEEALDHKFIELSKIVLEYGD
ncbi:SGNH/GDSL hydrolase family protein [Alteromonas gracilis]|uniref:SGNH hydrolase-type esterase domain-containing protein n=1 Tax=Alteromonas gracilis TaxID=1479524 RepID=A0ABX5CQM7_9ALTE|nr:SGNH/GDSL hydrolase family protein [Alteromonas gracilis]PRO69894.1 hypothetical protein C6Y39_05485 [Alteromonas gracilis]